MSAECMKCGYDLPYEADCEFCSLRARAERAEEALRETRAAVKQLQRRYERREQLHTSDFTAALVSQPKEEGP